MQKIGKDGEQRADNSVDLSISEGQSDKEPRICRG